MNNWHDECVGSRRTLSSPGATQKRVGARWSPDCTDTMARLLAIGMREVSQSAWASVRVANLMRKSENSWSAALINKAISQKTWPNTQKT